MKVSTIENTSLKKVIGQEKLILFALFLYSFLLLMFCSKMSPLYLFNSWPDVNIYFNMGKGMMSGLTLYKDIFDHKGPLIFFIYGIGYLISNDTFTGVYIIESVCFFFGILAVYLLARHYLNKVYSFAVVILFSYAALAFSGFGGAAEDYILILEAISLLFYVRYFLLWDNGKAKNSYMFIQGVCIILAFFIKLNFIIFQLILVSVLFLSLLFSKKHTIFLKNLTAFLLGCLVVTIPFLFYFAFNSALTDFWDGYITFNAVYANAEEVQLFSTLKLIAIRGLNLFSYSPFVFGCGFAGVLIFSLTSVFIKNIWGRMGLLASFIAVTIIVLMPTPVMEYYYIIFAIFSTFSGICIFWLVQKYIPISDTVYIIVLLSILGIFINFKSKPFFTEQEAREAKSHAPNKLGVEFAFTDIIKQEKKPTLLCLGLDKGLGVFTTSNIIPNTKYFFYPNVYHEKYPDIRNSQDEYIREKKVQFIVISSSFREYDHYMNLEDFTKNYIKIKAYRDKGKAYFLYKRIDY